MARTPASPLFRRLAGRGVFFLFLLRWVLRLAAFVIRVFILHGSSLSLREDSLDDCGRPCDPLSCLIFSALWLRCNPTILVQETPSMKNVDPTCSTTFLFGDATCLPVGPMSLDWPVNPCGSSDPSGPSLLPRAPNGAQQRGAFPAIGYSRWRQGALQAQPQISQRTTGCDGYGPLPLRRSALCYLKHPGASLDLFFYKTKEQRIQTQLSQKTFGRTTTSFVSRKCIARTSFFKLSRYWLRDFDYLGTLLPDNENAGGSAICIQKDLVPDEGYCDTFDYLSRPRSNWSDTASLLSMFILNLSLP